MLALILTPFLLVVFATLAAAAELQPRTIAAFDRYVRVTETRMDGSGPFLWIDGLSAPQRAAARETLRRDELIIERLTSRDRGQSIEVPGGMIHHWLGLAFVADADIDRALALLQNYNAHGEIYRPNVARSRLLSREGNTFRFYLRFFMKRIISVVVNSEHEARFTRPAADRAEGRIHSTRIAEVEDPDTPEEHELPVGRDGGYLWRLNTYWRLLQRDGGTYIQCESISLTRGIPTGFGWLVGPFVTSIPRDTLTFTLDTTRTYLAKQHR